MTTKELPENLTIERIEAAARDSMFGLGSTGFCKACGAERDGCEGDAENYECFDCGAMAVDGAESLLITYL